MNAESEFNPDEYWVKMYVNGSRVPVPDNVSFFLEQRKSIVGIRFRNEAINPNLQVMEDIFNNNVESAKIIVCNRGHKTVFEMNSLFFPDIELSVGHEKPTLISGKLSFDIVEDEVKSKLGDKSLDEVDWWHSFR